MAVPSGYKWVRELDPSAVYQNGVVKALGKTYNPGEYYMESGRAYVPNPVPEGAQWIRSYFPGGQVSYDQATGKIGLPGGLELQGGNLPTVGGKTYISPSQLATYYQTHAATYKPKPPTAEEVKRQSEALMQVYGPLMDVTKERIGMNLKAIQEQADQQRRLAEAAYQGGLKNLQQRETGTWNTIMKSALSRGLGASPLTSYEQRKVAEAYAPEYQQLETNRAAQLANIASQAALSAEELAMQGRDIEAQWASKIAEYAYNAMQSSAAEQKQAIQSLADYFANLASQELQKSFTEAGLTGMYQGQPTWERLATEAGLTGMYQGQPTWERQYQAAQLANARAKATSGGGGAGGGANLSSTEAKNLTRGTYTNMIKKEIDAEWKKGGWAQAKKALADIEARIWQDAGELMKAGLTYNDIISLVNYARSLVGGIPAYSASGSYVEEP